AGALVDLVGLDAGRVLLWSDGNWKTEAVRRAGKLTPDTKEMRMRALGSQIPSPPSDEWQPSTQVLNRLLAEKKTFWQEPAKMVMGTQSLMAYRSSSPPPSLIR